MAKRKKPTKPVSKLELVDKFIENPDWEPAREGEKGFPRKIKATVNVRESAISTLAARKDSNGNALIDEAQVLAADRFRRFWEASGGAGAKAMDYTRDKVDGGQIADPIDIAQMNAARKLGEAEHTLGERNYQLVRRVCGEGAAMSELYSGKRDRLTATDNLRSSLDDLARIWGIATTASNRPNTKHRTPKKHDVSLYTQRTKKVG